MTIKEIAVKLLLEQPFYGYVLAATSFHKNYGIDTIKMAAIPNLSVAYNPEWFDGLENNHKLGVLIHELLHIVFLHPYRRNNKDIAVWSAACDMATNEWLRQAYLFEDAITVSKITEHYGIQLEKKMTAEYYYDQLMAIGDRLSFVSSEKDVVVVFEGHENLKATMMSDEPATTMDIKNITESVSNMLEQASLDSRMDTEIKATIEDIYPNPKIHWRVMLKRFLTGRGKMVVSKSYKRQSRRYEGVAGTKRAIGVNALLAIDESGSISDGMVRSFYKELLSLNRITGAEILVTRFDTDCSEPVPIAQMTKESHRMKRGGTDFRPVFELADALRMPLVIFFTDGDGEAPEHVHQKVLWVLTGNKKRPASYGHYVNYEVNE